MCAWVQSVVDSRGWDWRCEKSEGLQTELLVWFAHDHLSDWRVIGYSLVWCLILILWWYRMLLIGL